MRQKSKLLLLTLRESSRVSGTVQAPRRLMIRPSCRSHQNCQSLMTLPRHLRWSRRLWAWSTALRVALRRASDARQERAQANHPVIGKFLLAVFDDPQSTRAWSSGEVG